MITDPAIKETEARGGEERPTVDVSHLITEDDTPVDNIFSEREMRLLTGPLHASWKPGVPFVAMANVAFYFTLNAPALVPDMLLSVDVEIPADPLPKEHRSYFMWLYGKAPDVVVEIVSNRVGGELDRKLRTYAAQGVPYYVVFDPAQFIQEEPLQCFELEKIGGAASYRRMAEARFPNVGLQLVFWEGEFEAFTARWLRWADADGRLIPLGSELAETERQRADSECQRAESERQRADRLAAKLRAAGIDPDAP